MIIDVKPKKVEGCVKIVTSKSYAHRYILANFLADNPSAIHHASLCDDTMRTLDAASLFEKKANIIGDSIEFIKEENNNILSIDCNESASTLRFLIPICLVKGLKITFTGKESLFKRGLEPYIELFKNFNIKYSLLSGALLVDGQIDGGTFEVDALASSQYLTGLLLALPIAKKDSIIKVKSDIVSRGYIDITLDVLKKCHIHVEEEQEGIFKIPGNQQYLPPTVNLYADYSATANMLAFNMIGGNVVVVNENPASYEPDAHCYDLFKKLECPNPIIDIKNNIDLGPILMSLAAVKLGATFINVNRLINKESNRLDAMMNLLNRFGITTIYEENKLIVMPSKMKKPQDIIKVSDHRIMMAAMFLLSITGGSLEGSDCVKKSYPNYLSDLKQLNYSFVERN